MVSLWNRTHVSQLSCCHEIIAHPNTWIFVHSFNAAFSARVFFCLFMARATTNNKRSILKGMIGKHRTREKIRLQRRFDEKVIFIILQPVASVEIKWKWFLSLIKESSLSSLFTSKLLFWGRLHQTNFSMVGSLEKSFEVGVRGFSPSSPRFDSQRSQEEDRG